MKKKDILKKPKMSSRSPQNILESEPILVKKFCGNKGVFGDVSSAIVLPNPNAAFDFRFQMPRQTQVSN